MSNFYLIVHTFTPRVKPLDYYSCVYVMPETSHESLKVTCRSTKISVKFHVAIRTWTILKSLKYKDGFDTGLKNVETNLLLKTLKRRFDGRTSVVIGFDWKKCNNKLYKKVQNDANTPNIIMNPGSNCSNFRMFNTSFVSDFHMILTARIADCHVTSLFSKIKNYQPPEVLVSSKRRPCKNLKFFNV